VLGVEFDPNQPPLADGQKVLDLVAFHPATANHICHKLCKRLISDNPPPIIVKGATAVWVKNRDNPHQIRETLRYILSSKRFTQDWGQKVKTPFELIASILRLTQADFTPNYSLTNFMNQMGYLHYKWPTPTGHPDRSSYWLSSSTMLMRWNIAMNLLNNPPNKLAQYDFKSQMKTGETITESVKFWTEQILQRTKPDEFISAITSTLLKGKDSKIVASASEIKKSIPTLIAILTMTPDFQLK
jgi:uncharacterized protein (DUF1800 family)